MIAGPGVLPVERCVLREPIVFAPFHPHHRSIGFDGDKE